MKDVHPIFIPNGYQINTRPTEHIANLIVSNISQGFHGCGAYAGGGVGKTSAQHYLSDHSSRWLIDSDRQLLGVAARMIMPSGVRRNDRAFWDMMNQRLHLANVISIDPGLALNRIVTWVATRCGQARVRRMVLFVDNSQRITDLEYQYLEDLDGLIAEKRLSLFLVLFRQSDSEGIDIGDDWMVRPSHTVRRWFMDTTPFRPLVGIADVTHALGRYDTAATWPTPDMPFSRYFAKAAFDRGWTLASEAALLCDSVKELRKEHRLPESEAWPMATFTLVVHHLLSEIAARNPEFNGFTTEDVRQALLYSGYLRLEYVRARMYLPEASGLDAIGAQ